MKTCPKNGDTPEAASTYGAVAIVKAEFDTSDVFNFCFPKIESGQVKEAVEKIKDWMRSSSNGKYVYDLYLSSRAIYISCAMSLVYSFLYIYLMSAFAETIAWIAVALVQLGLIGCTVGSYFYRANLIKDANNAIELGLEGWSKPDGPNYASNLQY